MGTWIHTAYREGPCATLTMVLDETKNRPCASQIQMARGIDAPGNNERGFIAGLGGNGNKQQHMGERERGPRLDTRCRGVFNET